MPEPDYFLRENDSGSTITATLRDENDAAVDINGATVRFHMVAISGGTAKVSAAASNDQNGDGADGTKGQVSYEWQAADTDTPGLYLAEWEVTYVGGDVVTYPNAGYLLVRVTPQIASAP